MIEWNIQTRSRACQACHKSFVDKDIYYTLLLDQRGGLERFDVCEDCWKSQYSQGVNHRKGFISFWQGAFAAPVPPPPEPIQKENAESLLRQITEQNDPQFAAVAFILAAMLERKRLLKVKATTTQDGQRITVYEHIKTGEVLTIPDPKLQLNQLESVQHQVAQLLQHGLNPPVAPAAAPAANPAEGTGSAAVTGEISEAVPGGAAGPESASSLPSPPVELFANAQEPFDMPASDTSSRD
jgi:hypothetical protein